MYYPAVKVSNVKYLFHSYQILHSEIYFTHYIRVNLFFSRMAGGDSVDESQLKGLSKYFNSQTNRGRANVAKATYAFFGAIILYYSLKPKAKK